MMSELDKLIVRCWSAVVARGEAGTVSDVSAELRARGLAVLLDELSARMTTLHMKGQLP